MNSKGDNLSAIIVAALVATTLISVIAIVLIAVLAPDNSDGVEKIILIAVPTCASLMAFLQSTRNSAKIDSVSKQVNGHYKEKEDG